MHNLIDVLQVSMHSTSKTAHAGLPVTTPLMNGFLFFFLRTADKLAHPFSHSKFIAWLRRADQVTLEAVSEHMHFTGKECKKVINAIVFESEGEMPRPLRVNRFGLP